MSDLTPKQRRFVDEYMIDLNATQAAIRAGYSERSAASQGERLLRNDEIAAAVAEAQKDRAERTEVTQDRVLAMLEETRDAAHEVGQHSAATRAAELLGKPRCRHRLAA